MVGAIRFVTGVFGSVLRLYFIPFSIHVNRLNRLWFAQVGRKGVVARGNLSQKCNGRPVHAGGGESVFGLPV